MERTLDSVEDELTSVPFDPSQWRNDGRMYPFQDDSMLAPDNPFIAAFRSRHHRTYIGVNGAIEIRDKTDAVIFSKAGVDSRTIEQLRRQGEQS